MATPAFGMFESGRHFAHTKGHLVHRLQIGIQALAGIEPFFLTAMGGQGFALDRLHGCCVHESPGNNTAPQSVSQSVRHGMIDGHVFKDSGSSGGGFKIAHPARECCRDRQAAGVRVVLHVILR